MDIMFELFYFWKMLKYKLDEKFPGNYFQSENGMFKSVEFTVKSKVIYCHKKKLLYDLDQ